AELVKCIDNKSSLIPPEIASEFIGKKKGKLAGEEFVLGWNLPSRRNSASGHFFSASSIGHLGFTGCSIWIDIEAGFRIILLTNRIHPTPMNEKIKSFRPRIHDLIYNELLSG
ncbi:MAG TPA: serine hydrolase, partial [bacterium]|nr:serine hydrolase [bacterium]